MPDQKRDAYALQESGIAPHTNGPVQLERPIGSAEQQEIAEALDGAAESRPR